MSNNEEIWKPIGFKDVLVSNLGRVKRGDGFLYSIVKCKNGYNYVSLSLNNKTVAKKVARLVALAFIPNPENKKNIDHINTDRTDDRVENLRWATWDENNKNPLTIAHKKASQPKERPWKKRKIAQYSKDGKFIRFWDSATDFAKYLNKDVGTNIAACIRGKQPTAYGYKWQYADQLIFGREPKTD